MARCMGVAGAGLLLAAVAAVFVFHAGLPTLPRDGLDPSWIAVMGEAADRPARWGVETAFTYGPASPVVTGYANAAYLTRTVPMQLGFAAVFGWCAALLLARGGGRRALLGTLACAAMLVAARGMADALVLAMPAMVLLLSLRAASERGARAAALAGAVALGLSGMTKMSFPLAALPVLALADAATLCRRRPPLLLGGFALGIGAGALLYGQRLSDLPAYLALQGEVAAGYGAAMALDGPDWDLLPFLVLAPALVAALAIAGRGPGRGLAATGVAAGLLVLFKAGFIRHDLHSTLAWTGLGLLGTVAAWDRLPRRGALAVTGLALAVVLVYLPAMTVRQSVREGRGAALAELYRTWLMAEPARTLGSEAALLFRPAHFRAGLAADKAAAWAAIAAAGPLGPLPGPVDIIPSAQTRVMAAGLDYRGRPSFQEYSTYTAGLAAANRAFLAGDRAPRWVLFGPESPLGIMALDGRFPGFAEGALWRDLLGLYRPDHRIGPLVALERRPAPVPVPLGPARTEAVALGAFAPVAGTGPLWATVDIRPNPAGRVLAALFRPPLLTLAVRLADGGERRFRLVPAQAASGFLLSPLVDNASDFEALAAGEAAGAGRRVTGLAVEGSRAGRWFYAPEVRVTLRAMDTSRLAAAPGAPPSPPDAPAALPAVLTLPLRAWPAAGGRRHVTLRYGLGFEAAAGPVCFVAEPADGSGTALLHDCLRAGGGRATGTATLDLPEAVTELALETRCPTVAPCGGAWGWTAPDGSAASVPPGALPGAAGPGVAVSPESLPISLRQHPDESTPHP